MFFIYRKPVVRIELANGAEINARQIEVEASGASLNVIDFNHTLRSIPLAEVNSLSLIVPDAQ